MMPSRRWHLVDSVYLTVTMPRVLRVMTQDVTKCHIRLPDTIPNCAGSEAQIR